MPATVYRGDLAEVTFGHETGLVLTHGAFGGLTMTVGTPGTIATFAVVSGGTGYTTTANAALTVLSGNGHAGSGSLIADLSKEDGQVATTQVQVNGTGYVVGEASSELAQASTTGSGTGLKIDVTSISVGGGILTFTIADPGQDHAVGNVITMAQAAATGTQAQIKILSINNGVITAAAVDSVAANRGADFVVGDRLSVSTADGSETGGVLRVASVTAADSTDVSSITFSATTAGFFDGQSELRYPRGMLAGSTLRVRGGGNFGNDDHTKGHVYTIVDNYGAVLKVTPAMNSSGASTTDDELVIESLGVPSIDIGMSYNTSAVVSDESVLTDQFVGLAATVALPETTVNIKRSHVVGVGRDVVVQEAQSMKNEGGTIETMMHSPRWLYYALGNEAIHNVEPTGVVQVGATHAKAIGMGDTFIEFSDSATLSVSEGNYITVTDNTEVLTPYSKEPTTRSIWGDSVDDPNANLTQFHSSIRSEIRRVVAVDSTAGFKRIYVDDPFNFDHAAACEVNKIVLTDTNATGTPHFETEATTYGNIQNRQKRAIWSMSSVPSFSLEASIRSRNVGSYGTGAYAGSQATNAPGSANDSKQLTRVFKGCKVKDWELTADQDAEVKMSVNFDALMCYTDTGRLESTAGDRYTAHRMFENVGNGPSERKAAGIAPNTEKPYFFYNGTITAFGQNIAQVTKFSVKGENGLQQYYTVGAQPLAEARNSSTGNSLEQVPFAGSRNPTLVAEGAVEYEANLEIIVSDPLLYHEFRTVRSKDYTEPITLHLVKNGAGTAREEMFVIIDDYILEEAPLQIPEDKTPIKSELKIKPKHVKVVSYDALLHC